MREMAATPQPENLPNSTWKRIFRLVEWAFIAGLVIYTFRLLSTCLSVPWFFSSDEVVYTAEVLKLLRLNFNQNFFDIPGTPFMFLSAILWAIWYAVLSISGQIPHDLSIKLFTFQNFEQFYGLMRLLVLIFYALSIVLTYIVGKRLTNAVGGCVAALLLAFFPPYTSYSTFVRTESMGICLALIAFYLVLDGLARNRPRKYLLAGICSGIATAARYHFVLATLPQLFMVVFLQPKTDEKAKSEPLQRWTVILAGLMGAVLLSGSLLTLLLSLKLMPPNWLTDRLLISPEDPTLPKALSVTRKLWLGLGVFALSVLIALRIPKLRPWGLKIIQPAIVFISFGFGIGLILGMPTFLWRGVYLLKSIQFYSDWIDYERLKLNPLAQYLDMFSSYWKIIAPTPFLGFLLVAGSGLIIFRRDKALYPVLAGAMLTFLAQPVLLPTAPHRSLPWAPYLVMVQAYPFAVVFDWIRKTNKRRFTIQFIGLCSLVLVNVGLINAGYINNGIRQAVDTIDQLTMPRLNAINQISNWLDANVEANTAIWMSFYSFNKEIQYTLIEHFGASIPEQIKRLKPYLFWYYDRSSLANSRGYIVACKQDMSIYVNDWNNKKPGEGVNPFTEPGFIERASFSGGGYDFSIFQYDFRS